MPIPEFQTLIVPIAAGFTLLWNIVQQTLGQARESRRERLKVLYTPMFDALTTIKDSYIKLFSELIRVYEQAIANPDSEASQKDIADISQYFIKARKERSNYPDMLRDKARLLIQGSNVQEQYFLISLILFFLEPNNDVEAAQNDLRVRLDTQAVLARGSNQLSTPSSRLEKNFLGAKTAAEKLSAVRDAKKELEEHFSYVSRRFTELQRDVADGRLTD
jgi:hypothetical protein